MTKMKEESQGYLALDGFSVINFKWGWGDRVVRKDGATITSHMRCNPGYCSR